MLQIPLVHIPTKRTDEVDFAPAFTSYIQTVYQEDAKAYTSEISNLNQLRQNVRGAGKDITGLHVLYRYHGQLNLLDLRFPIDEEHVKIQFHWFDAFSQKKVTQYSVAFEKASMIFNIAATCSSIAALKDRSDPTSLKHAFNYFQTSAGMFLYINDHFLHPPSVDMSRDSIKVLADLMLAQAQECFIEKAIVENRKGAIVAKLAMCLSSMYGNINDGLANPALKNQFRKAWVELLKAGIETNYGDVVTLSQAAADHAYETVTLANYFTGNYPNFTVSLETSAPAASITTMITDGIKYAFDDDETKSIACQALEEMCKSMMQKTLELKNIAIKDNDMIYHEKVPILDGMPPLEKMNAVKVTTFADLLPDGPAGIPVIIGHDLFHKLIAIRVHESASVYSLDKEKLIRKARLDVENADGDYDGIMMSLDVKHIVSRLKNGMIKSTSREIDLEMPEELANSIMAFSSQQQGTSSIDDLIFTISTMKPKIKFELHLIMSNLNQEQQTCETYRGKFQTAWTQESSSKITLSFHQNLNKYSSSIESASEIDFKVLKSVDALQKYLVIFKEPIRSITQQFEDTLNTFAPQVVQNLLEEDLIGVNDDQLLGTLGEQMTLEKLDSVINRLNSLKKDRDNMINELKQMAAQDDITSRLVLNPGREAQFFQAELGKYAPLQGKISSNIETHVALLEDLTTEFTKLQSGSQARQIEMFETKKVNLESEWNKAIRKCFECNSSLENARKFYTEMVLAVKKLANEVDEFIGRRASEAKLLADNIEFRSAEKNQLDLQSKLSGMNLSSPVSKYSSPPVNYSQLGNANLNYASPQYSAPQQQASQNLPSPVPFQHTQNRQQHSTTVAPRNDCPSSNNSGNYPQYTPRPQYQELYSLPPPTPSHILSRPSGIQHHHVSYDPNMPLNGPHNPTSAPPLMPAPAPYNHSFFRPAASGETQQYGESKVIAGSTHQFIPNQQNQQVAGQHSQYTINQQPGIPQQYMNQQPFSLQPAHPEDPKISRGRQNQNQGLLD